MRREIHSGMPEDSIKELGALLRDSEFAMLTTTSEDGSLHSRPMIAQESENGFDGRIWLFTSRNSGKVGAIKKDQHVNLAFADVEEQKYISVAGRAEIVDDEQKLQELWRPSLFSWFPKGLQDPELCLIKIEVESAEYWTPDSDEYKSQNTSQGLFAPSTEH